VRRAKPVMAQLISNVEDLFEKKRQQLQHEYEDLARAERRQSLPAMPKVSYEKRLKAKLRRK